ncbi:hypothetical protein [Phormidium nigroviride]
MPNPQGTKKNLKPMNSPWVHKPTRTIRVPIVFADAALEYIRKLDNGEDKSSDTVVSLDTHDRILNLESELAEARAQLSTQSDPAYHADVVALRKELKAEIQRFKDTENSLRGNDVSWQMRVTALKDEVKEVEAKLLRQNDTNRKLEKELAEVREQSDKQSEKREKWINELLEENRLLRHRVQELEGTGSLLRIEEKKNKELEQERKELREQLNGLLELQTSQAQELRKVRSQLASQTAPQLSEIVEFPDAADLLNQLKAKRKKSKIDLQDVEAILELLPEMPAAQQPQAQLPDLYAARDKLFEMPSLGGWKLEKGEKRERFWAFANAMIEEVVKLDPNYSLLARLQSDLKQEQEYSKGLAKGMSEEFTKRVNIEKKMGLRR